MLRFYQGGLSVTEYDSLSWDRHQVLFAYMEAVEAERAAARAN